MLRHAGQAISEASQIYHRHNPFSNGNSTISSRYIYLNQVYCSMAAVPIPEKRTNPATRDRPRELSRISDYIIAPFCWDLS